jgi:AraC-like DNA-binding protein
MVPNLLTTVLRSIAEALNLSGLSMVQLQNLSSLIPNISINIQVCLLEEAGLEVKSVLTDAGLTRRDLDDAALLVSGTQELAVQRGFARITRDHKYLWIALALRYRLFVYNPFGFALITAPSLLEVINLTQSLSQLHFGLMTYDIIEDDQGNTGIETHYDDSLSDISDFLLCRDTIAVTTWLHELWGGDFPFIKIEAASALPQEGGFDYKAPVVNTDGPSRWFWPKSLMSMKPHYSDPVLHKIYLAQCRSINSEIATVYQVASNTSDKLLGKIMDLLGSSERFDWTLDELARHLAMSRRSLQRKLAYRGITFRMIIDQNRYHAARKLLHESKQSISEIAWRLGFADASSFHQAFTRWAQMSPSAYRKGK